MAMSFETLAEVLSWTEATGGAQLSGLLYTIALDGVDPKSIPDDTGEVYALLHELVRQFANQFCEADPKDFDSSAHDLIVAIHKVMVANDKSGRVFARRKKRETGVLEDKKSSS